MAVHLEIGSAHVHQHRMQQLIQSIRIHIAVDGNVIRRPFGMGTGGGRQFAGMVGCPCGHADRSGGKRHGQRGCRRFRVDAGQGVLIKAFINGFATQIGGRFFCHCAGNGAGGDADCACGIVDC